MERFTHIIIIYTYVLELLLNVTLHGMESINSPYID